MTPPPTALTPEEQETYRLAKNKAVTNVDYGVLAIIRRLDAEVARLDALVRHAEADCVILRDRAVEASREGMEFLRQRDALARALAQADAAICDAQDFWTVDSARWRREHAAAITAARQRQEGRV